MNNKENYILNDEDMDNITGGGRQFIYEEVINNDEPGYNVVQIESTTGKYLTGSVFIHKDSWAEYKEENEAFGKFYKGAVGKQTAI